MRGIGLVAGREEGRLVGRSTFDGRVGAVWARGAAPADDGRVPASEGSVVGRSPLFGRSGRSPGGTTTTGG
jgi:hypothetical protein